jgi:hypothetical protein
MNQFLEVDVNRVSNSGFFFFHYATKKKDDGGGSDGE